MARIFGLATKQMPKKQLDAFVKRNERVAGIPRDKNTRYSEKRSERIPRHECVG